jgi:CIC family chloride channel protein
MFIAAVLFSLEEILGDFHAPVLGSVVLSSATAWMVLHLVLGDQPLFHTPAYKLVNPLEFGVYAILGVVGGLGSVCFVKLLLYLRLWFGKLPKSTVWIQPAIGGLALGLMGWFIPEVLGVGYGYVDRVLGGDFPVKTVAMLALLKIVATPICYSSGNAGGIFGPSLFIGAMIGGTVGGVAHTLFPSVTASPGAYALVGMGAAFAGIVRTPMTSVIMIFEMTRDYAIIVPLMIANMISFAISRVLQPEPIYEALALQEGVHLPKSEARRAFEGVRVSAIMDREARPMPPATDIDQAMAFLDGARVNSWPVGTGSRVHGVVNVQQVQNADQVLTVGDLISRHDAYPLRPRRSPCHLRARPHAPRTSGRTGRGQPRRHPRIAGCGDTYTHTCKLRNRRQALPCQARLDGFRIRYRYFGSIARREPRGDLYQYHRGNPSARDPSLWPRLSGGFANYPV